MPMPRGNGVYEMSQRTSRPPLQLKTMAAELEGVQIVRHSVERSPKFNNDRRSPRRSATITEKKPSVNSDLQKKRNSRVSALETQLDQAQNEVKKLKEQLASAEIAKKEAELELEETKKQIGTPQCSLPDDDLPEGLPEPPETPPGKEEKPVSMKQDDEVFMEENLDLLETDSKGSNKAAAEMPEDSITEAGKQSEVSTTEVSETELGEMKPEHSIQEVGEIIEFSVTEIKEETLEDPVAGVTAELPAEQQIENGSTESIECGEVKEMKAKLLETNQKLIRLSEENEFLRLCLLDAEELKAKDAEMGKRLSQVTEELQESNKKRAQVTEQLEVVIQAKAELEAEMKRVKVQTEQWRKAAEAAAAIVASTDRDMEMNGRSRSTNKQHGFDKYAGWNHPGTDFMEDEHSAKRNGSSGKKRFGDLWKKK